MRIALLCATQRGYLSLKVLTEILPHAELVVFSFPEEPWEPPFLRDIREWTLSHNGRFFEARQVGHPQWIQYWESAVVDLMLVVNWRYRIPAGVYARPRVGTFVFHDSLLPEYRGFSPTTWAIINGEDHTGVTLFEIAQDIDAGDIVDQHRVPIGPEDTIAAVMQRVTEAHLRVLRRNLDGLLHHTAPRRPQDHSCATYGCKRVPEDNQIDWTTSSARIHNLIRAVSAPYPGAYTSVSGQGMRVWAARRIAQPRQYLGRIPGRVVEVWPGEGTVVLTGDGSLLLMHVQMEGGAIACAADVLNIVGQTLGH